MTAISPPPGVNPVAALPARREPLWLHPVAMILCAMAGGMGWGIRGQYGHETGAMVAGVLFGFTAVLLFIPNAASLTAARVVALVAIGVSFGGSETYGQTIGLTQDAPLIGNWPALRWGLLGLFIKGGIWIGFAGLFLGLGLSGKRYRLLEMAGVMLSLLVFKYLGTWLLNEPFDPANKLLPRFYFSDDWYWEPDSELKPRREIWGGLLLALAALTVYVGAVRRDRLALNLALVGFVAGGLGFAGGQCVQAYHAWNVEWFRTGPLTSLEPHMNWWNMMETSFGLIFGAILALGLWCNRKLILPTGSSTATAEEEVRLNPIMEGLLAVAYVVLLITAEFYPVRYLSALGADWITVGALPVVAILGGRYWPYLVALPLVAVPICGKSLRELSYRNSEVPAALGWILIVAIPLVAMTWIALKLASRGKRGELCRPLARDGLLITTWLYFLLNFGFFRLPWPWAAWTGRTPSGILFTICAVSLTVAAIAFGWSSKTTR